MAVIQKRLVNSPRRRSMLADYKRTKGRMRRVMEAHAEELKKMFEAFVSDWDVPPQFTVEITLEPGRIKVTVRPYKKRKSSQRFEWVDKGTEPHVIVPRPDNPHGLLFFQLDYQPHTMPVAQAHVGPGEATGPLVVARFVNHPGTEPRLVSETIQEQTYPDFRKAVEAMFRVLAREATSKTR